MPACRIINDPTTHYCIVRADLPPGMAAAQIIHAAGESSPGNIPAGTFAVALVADYGTLIALDRRLNDAGVPHVAVREPDEPYCGELLAIGIEPAPKSVIQKFVSSIPLYARVAQ